MHGASTRKQIFDGGLCAQFLTEILWAERAIGDNMMKTLSLHSIKEKRWIVSNWKNKKT